MATFCSPADCQTCPGRVVCYCLHVTEEVVVDAIQNLGLRSVKDVRQHTRAGDGCTACRRHIQQLLETHTYATAE